MGKERRGEEREAGPRERKRRSGLGQAQLARTKGKRKEKGPNPMEGRRGPGQPGSNSARSEIFFLKRKNLF